ncbi:pentatricopeptide repeat-containing protein At5g67570, chloroplastic-like [Dendrobium catenatum]|uniref:pentatricopeptide repeat-containing protein At5g67570, chloroplastic-like n=1 Tax=Dendrobium catenatum TaxID=906689 RepID=UPI00109EE828|nr:pentatricopeptide repeat-containing protein At5g67570, chloroplastic-like [Dendrobium catenatum]
MDAFPAALSGCFASHLPRSDGKVFEPNLEVIKQRLLRKGIVATPKILHTLRKKEIQKYLRRTKKLNKREENLPLTEPQMRALEEDKLFRTATAEYRTVMAEVDSKREIRRELVGRPWKRLSSVDMVKLGSEADGLLEKKLNVERLEELRNVLVERNGEILRWFIDDADVESFEVGGEESRAKAMNRRHSMEQMSDDERIQLLARRLSSTNLSIQDWKFSRLMKHSGLLFSEMCMLEIIEKLGALRNWKQALSIVKWVYNQQEYKNCKSRKKVVTTVYIYLGLQVMLKARKYDHVHKFFDKMQQGRLAPKAISYKVLVRTFWEQGKLDEAVAAVREMERRGVIGTPGVYYELACCLCNNGRWLDATMEVEKLKKLPHTKPLEVTFTGMILASLAGGYVKECISIYDYMKDHCTPNIGTINAMLKVYGCSDMFAKAKQLFEAVKDAYLGVEASAEVTALKPDAYTFTSMLVASASACQWEFFEHVYKEMALYGCMLDMSKHSWLLVEASKAGKWHLVEHAFNTCLESGEIPHLSLFTEMLCQTIIQQNFERVNPLLNGMAHASLQISESKWLSLLQRNEDRFGLDALQGLLTHLHSSSLVMEQPIPDLLRSLESLCERATPRTSILASSLDNSTEYSTFHEKEEVKNLAFPAKHCDVHVHLQETSKSVAYSLRVGNEKREWDSLLDIRSETLVTESVLDHLTDAICNSSSRVPLAADILQSWKDARRENGFNDTDESEFRRDTIH